MMKEEKNKAASGTRQQETVLRPEDVERLRRGLVPKVGMNSNTITEPLVKHYKHYISDILSVAGLPRKYELVNAYQKGKLATFKVKQDELYSTIQIDNSKTAHINVIVEHHLPQIIKEVASITLPTPTERARSFNVNIIYMPYARKFYRYTSTDDRELIVEVKPQFIIGMAALVTEDKNLFLAFARKYVLNNRKNRFTDIVYIKSDKEYDLYKNIGEREIEKYARKVAIIAFHSYLPNNEARELPITLLISNANVHINTTYTYTFDKDGVTYTYVINVFATKIIYVDREKNVLYTPYANLGDSDTVLSKFMDYHNVARVATELPSYAIKNGRLVIYNVWRVNIEEALKFDVDEIELSFEQIKRVGLITIKRARKVNELPSIKRTYAKYYYSKTTKQIYLIILALDTRYKEKEVGVITDRFNGFPVVVLITGSDKYYEIINRRGSDIDKALDLLNEAYHAVRNGKRQTLLDSSVIDQIADLVIDLQDTNTDRLITSEALKEELFMAVEDKIISDKEAAKYLKKFDEDPIRTLEELIEKGVIVR